MFYPTTLFIHGFILSASLIVAIGVQNAFVLRQGLRQEHVFAVASLCFFFDTLFIFIGVGGLGSIISQNPRLSQYVVWGGCAFLVFYGLRSLRAAFTEKHKLAPQAAVQARSNTLREVIIATVGFSILNPHVYLDTIVLIGGLAARYDKTGKILFALGASSASLVWFFALAYGAAQLAPVFRKPSAWRTLDFIIGCTMIANAGSILLGH